MLSLLIKSFWWVAWWPVSTWLLTGEKAASRHQPGSGRRGQLRGQESNMADEAFMKPEVPDAFRDLMQHRASKTGVRHLCGDERTDVEDVRDELANGKQRPALSE